jgi:hypothetical protein
MKVAFYRALIVLSVVFLAWNNPALAEETKKVCKEKVDKAGKPVLDKAGKPQEECKTIKVHKKLEVEAQPAKK